MEITGSGSGVERQTPHHLLLFPIHEKQVVIVGKQHFRALRREAHAVEVAQCALVAQSLVDVAEGEERLAIVGFLVDDRHLVEFQVQTFIAPPSRVF